MQGLDAFGARLALADRAEVSIDAQYFLMKPDDAGVVFAAKLLEAADRGVRVRLLLDDVFTTVNDSALALLDVHPNVEVRIFNPVARQGLYAINYAGNFRLSNRRMHNKSFTVDSQVTVVGGRNIAVEYFQLEATGEFMDFDMLTAGPIVRKVSQSFDDYWNDELAVPLAALYSSSDRETVELGMAEMRRRMEQAGNSIYAAAIDTELMKKLYEDELPPFLAEARLIVDKPQKLREDFSAEYQVVGAEIRDELEKAEREVIVWTPYLVPGDSGVELWETRADAVKTMDQDGSTTVEQLTLHTKGILIDGRRVFAGSLNLDPRSVQINTEMGLLIESEALSRMLTRSSLEAIPDLAYRLRLDDRRRIQWHATIDGDQVIETSEPQASWWLRFSAWVQKIAPEGQL